VKWNIVQGTNAWLHLRDGRITGKGAKNLRILMQNAIADIPDLIHLRRNGQSEEFAQMIRDTYDDKKMEPFLKKLNSILFASSTLQTYQNSAMLLGHELEDEMFSNQNVLHDIHKSYIETFCRTSNKPSFHDQNINTKLGISILKSHQMIAGSLDGECYGDCVLEGKSGKNFNLDVEDKDKINWKQFDDQIQNNMLASSMDKAILVMYSSKDRSLGDKDKNKTPPMWFVKCIEADKRWQHNHKVYAKAADFLFREMVPARYDTNSTATKMPSRAISARVKLKKTKAVLTQTKKLSTCNAHVDLRFFDESESRRPKGTKEGTTKKNTLYVSSIDEKHTCGLEAPNIEYTLNKATNAETISFGDGITLNEENLLVEVMRTQSNIDMTEYIGPIKMDSNGKGYY